MSQVNIGHHFLTARDSKLESVHETDDDRLEASPMRVKTPRAFKRTVIAKSPVNFPNGLKLATETPTVMLSSPQNEDKALINIIDLSPSPSGTPPLQNSSDKTPATSTSKEASSQSHYKALNFLTATESVKVFPERKNEGAKFKNGHRKTHSLLLQKNSLKEIRKFETADSRST